MIIGLQIIAILFSFSMIYLAILSYKRRELGKVEVSSWLTIWILAIVIIVFPDLLRPFAAAFFVSRVFDLMVMAGFVLVISMVASVYLKTKRNEKKLEELVRKETLKKK